MNGDNSNFLELSSLCDRAALPLIDVRDDIRRHFKDCEARERILRNLEKIQNATQSISIDLGKLRAGEATSKYDYEWPAD